MEIHLYKDGKDTGRVTTTDSDGHYLFDNLIPGTYSLKFIEPAVVDHVGYVFTKKDQGNNDAKDSDVNPKTGMTTNIELHSGDNNLNWDAGMYKIIVRGGSQDRVAIGDLIWIEDDNDGNPATGNISYPPAGTVVTAKGSSGKMYTGKTDAHGHYEIYVDKNDTYMVTVQPLEFVQPTEGSTDSFISDTTSENNHSHNPNGTTVKVGEVDNLSVDFGFTKPDYAHLGDRFWYDKNGNGIQDPGEKPIVGATVELLDEDGNAVNDLHGQGSQITDENGKYGFDVEPGKTYRVRFVMLSQDVNEGFTFTTALAGNDPAKDSNADSSGTTEPITPLAGDNITTLDAGISCPCASIGGDSIDALGSAGKVLFVLMSLLLGMLFLPRIQEQKEG